MFFGSQPSTVLEFSNKLGVSLVLLIELSTQYNILCFWAIFGLSLLEPFFPELNRLIKKNLATVFLHPVLVTTGSVICKTGTAKSNEHQLLQISSEGIQKNPHVANLFSNTLEVSDIRGIFDYLKADYRYNLRTLEWMKRIEGIKRVKSAYPMKNSEWFEDVSPFH